MRRFLGVAVAAILALIQPSSVVQALAQTFNGAAASEGVSAVRALGAPLALPAAAGMPAPLALGASLNSKLVAPSAPALTAASASAFAAGEAAPALAAAVPAVAPASVAPEGAPALTAAPAAEANAPVPSAAPAAPPAGLSGLIARVRERIFPAKASGASTGAAAARAFDGSAASAAQTPDAPSAAALPPGRIRAYLVRAGQKPVMSTLEELPALAARTGFAADFNKNGHLRLVLADGKLAGPTLADADVAALKAALAAGGLVAADARTRMESIPLRTGLPSVEEASAAAAAKPHASRIQSAVRLAVGAGVAALYVAHFGMGNSLAPIFLAFVVANVDRAVRELAYAAGMLKAAFKESKTPRWNEVLGGVVGKIVPAIVNLGIFAAMYHGHPVALALSAALSLAVETFHGVWVNAWDTFQSKIGRHRGLVYQNVFNFIYGQMISGGFRTITYFTIGNVPPPWAIEYWKAVSLMTFIGTFCGTLGYRGLNSIYDKGRIPRWGRAGIQQLRDFCMMMIGPFFGTGNMFMTWLLFGIMQSVDLTIYAVDRRLETRPLIYLADERVASSDTFKAIYIDRASPFQEAVDGLKNSVLAKPFIAGYRWVAARVSRPKKN